MECCGGNAKLTEKELEDFESSKRIDKMLKEGIKNDNQKCNLLLLGTGDAGKTTFLKQMKVIHKDGIPHEEMERFINILRDNCLNCFKVIIEGCKNTLNIQIPKKYTKQVESIIEAEQLTDQVAKEIQKIYKVEFFAQALLRDNEMQLPGGGSGAVYFFDNAKRFAKKDFFPTKEDAIRARYKTTGLTQIEFTFDFIKFTLVDVGGQRDERRKWLHCFVDVTAVIYLAATNEYAMNLQEDEEANRMEESIKLFEKLSGSKWFLKKSFILFLNKVDLFEEEIKKRPLTDYFEDYDDYAGEYKGNKDDGELECSMEYIKLQYEKSYSGESLYTFFTCAVDTKNCEKVFMSVKDNIMRGLLSRVGI